MKKKNTRRKLKPPRQKDWRHAAEQWDDRDLPETERIMPIDENQRRYAVKKMDAQASPPPESDSEAPDDLLGLVIEAGGDTCRVQLEEGQIHASFRGSLKAELTGFSNLVAVGDQVIVTHTGSGEGVIEAVLPRRSVLARPNPSNPHLRQAIVANVDQLLIVASWREPHFWPELVDRYLVAAARNDLRPVICVNKLDLVEVRAELDAALKPYHASGFKLLPTSAATGEGIKALKQVLKGKASVLAGLSGVGKSSLINTVQPGLDLRTKSVSERGLNTNQGRHTTTQPVYLPLELGGAVVDTPGIREFGLSGLSKRDLAAYYPEFVAVAGKCEYTDCLHLDEPGCAVRAALKNGGIHPSRYASYKKILGELKTKLP